MSQKEDTLQIRHTIRLAQQGDEDAFAQVFSRYKPLIASVVNSFAADDLTREDKEDLYQEAVIAFHRAILRYDAEQSDVAFGLFAKICMNNALISNFRRWKRHSAMCAEGDVEATEDDGAENPVASLLEEERLSCLYEQIRNCLSPMEYRIWRLFVSGKTAREIGAEVKKEVKAVSNAIYRIRRKLRASIHTTE